MAKKDEPAADAAETTEATADAAAPEAAPAPEGEAVVQQTIRVDDDETIACYANFCRVSYTPEELILDMGVNPRPFGPGETTVKIQQRVILNFFTAKRLLNALAGTLQRHEQAFGVLETDVRKRVKQA